MVFSSYMKRSFLYPLLLYTLSLVMVVSDRDMVGPDPIKHFTKFGKFPPNFNNDMVFSSYMMRSYMYPLLLPP